MGIMEFFKLRRAAGPEPVRSPADMSADDLLKEETALNYDSKKLDRERQAVEKKMEEVKRSGLLAKGDSRVRLAEEFRDLQLTLGQARRDSACMHKAIRVVRRLRSIRERESRYKRPYLEIGKIQWDKIGDLLRDQEIKEGQMEAQLDRLLGVSEAESVTPSTDDVVTDILSSWAKEELDEAEGDPVAEKERKQREDTEPDKDFDA